MLFCVEDWIWTLAIGRYSIMFWIMIMMFWIMNHNIHRYRSVQSRVVRIRIRDRGWGPAKNGPLFYHFFKFYWHILPFFEKLFEINVWPNNPDNPPQIKRWSLLGLDRKQKFSRNRNSDWDFNRNRYRRRNLWKKNLPKPVVENGRLGSRFSVVHPICAPLPTNILKLEANQKSYKSCFFHILIEIDEKF